MTVSSAASGGLDVDRAARVGVIVLAAGEGTRMRSTRPKVLHDFAGRSMLGHVLAASAPLAAVTTAVVVGHGRDLVTAHLEQVGADVVIVVQHEQRGTGHAVRVALEAMTADLDAVVVLPGDAPLLTSATLAQLLATYRDSGAAATLLTSRMDDPSGYGRVLRGGDGAVEGVVEQKDATDAQRLVSEISAGVYAFDAALVRTAVRHLSTDNAQGEEYLPDVLSWLRAEGHLVTAVLAPAAETAGVNDRVQLAAAHRTYNQRIVENHMRSGVTVVDPATTWIDADVVIEADVVLEPGVQLKAGTRIGTAAVIGPDSTLRATTVGAATTVARSVTDSVTIGDDCTIGPFAYLRGHAELDAHVKVGTFVEVKNSTIGSGSKVPHLSYVGDATIGRRTNIGASTVFANYDGVTKNRSIVGDDVRISSDTTVVAPVTIGDGAYTGAGAVIREDVPADALAVSAGRQRTIEDWASRRRKQIAGRSGDQSTGADRDGQPSEAATATAAGSSSVHPPDATEDKG